MKAREMMMSEGTARVGVAELEQLIEALRGEAARIQIQGRALTEEEMATVERIYQALPRLTLALAILQGEGPLLA